MHHAGLLEVWQMLRSIVAQQTPFLQIMIALGAAFFVIMAIEGMRTSALAIRRAASPAPSWDVAGSEAPAGAADVRRSALTRLNDTKLAAGARRATPVRSARPLSFAKKG
jgi:hypothetical protein